MHLGIAGAGLVGRLCALRLLQQGHTVTLIDRDHKNGQQSCSFSAAAMLAPIAEWLHCEDDIVRRGLIAMQLWPKWLKTLSQPVYFQQQGTLLIAHRQDMNELIQCQQNIEHKLKAHPTWQKYRPLWIQREQFIQLEPQLNPTFEQGIYLPHEGQIAANMLMEALENTLMSYTSTQKTASLQWLSQMLIKSVQPYSIVCNDLSYPFDWVFDCRGLGAQSQQSDLRGVRGELIKLHAPEVTLNRPIRLMHPRYALYVVPRPDHHFLLGASSIENMDYSPISVRTMLELLSAAFSLHSGFAEARVIQTMTHCRPAFPDHLPRITHQTGLTSINGLYRHGYLLAPQLVQEAIDAVQCCTTTGIDLS